MKKMKLGLGFLVLALGMLVACRQDPGEQTETSAGKMEPNVAKTELTQEDVIYHEADALYVEDVFDEGFSRLDGKEITLWDSLCFPENGVYPMEPWAKEDTGLTRAVAIDAIGDYVLVVDDLAHEVVKLDLTGHRVDTFGQLGMGPGEFQNPRDVVYQETLHQIYVLDGGNHRVQIFDEDFSYLGEVGLAGLEVTQSPRAEYCRMEVDDTGNIFISMANHHPAYMRIFRLTPEGDAMYRYQGLFSGGLLRTGQTILAYETYRVYQYKDSDKSMDMVIHPAESLLFRLEGDEKVVAGEFPYLSIPSAVVVQGDRMYVMSELMHRIDEFQYDEAGLTYIKTLTEQLPNESHREQNLYDMILKEDTLYMTSKEDGEVYQIVLSGE